MLRDGRGGPCIITPEQSRQIAAFEGITLSEKQGLTKERRRIIEENIISSCPAQVANEMKAKLNNIHRELGDTPSQDEKSSKSYIIIKCFDNAEPRFNKIQLRTDPPTYIELQPGENILTAEEYPALKYGFRQIENFVISEVEHGDSDYCGEYNGGEIISVDLSHFDASEMMTMDNMFQDMQALSEIKFGCVKIEHVTSMVYAFSCVGQESEKCESSILDLSGIDFSKVTDASRMLSGCSFATVILTDCDFSSVKNAEDMFNCFYGKHLILDGANLSEEVVNAMWSCEMSDLESISLKRCDREMVRGMIELVGAIDAARPDCVKPIDIILDGGLDYVKNYDEDGAVDVLLIDRLKVSEKSYTEQGNKLERWHGESDWALIPAFVTSIADNAFEGCANLVGIILPDNVTIIGKSAFKGCKNLKYINIPTSVRTIGARAFSDCSSLKSLYIPDSVKSTGSLFNANSKVATLRIQMGLIYNAGLDSAKIGNLVIGLREEDRDTRLDLINLEPQYLDSDRWPNIIFEAAGISQLPFNEFMSVDGMVIGQETVEPENNDEYEEEYTTLFSLPKHVLAIPNIVHRLGKCSVALRTSPLYIPSSVSSIDEEAFCEIPKYRFHWFVTPKSNYNNLKTLLPVSLRNITIITI